MIVNITTTKNMFEVIYWVDNNPDIAKWVMGESLLSKDGVIYISSIEFFNSDDCLFYSLKFGLR